MVTIGELQVALLEGTTSPNNLSRKSASHSIVKYPKFWLLKSFLDAHKVKGLFNS